ncbi:MAG TPA: EAL domain-containing protein [Planosporangium sp.]|jgi:diguanylate cyclase (GGDEF)-like protein|nr:EAL domain-containing protein [Planosporangium sp.]
MAGDGEQVAQLKAQLATAIVAVSDAYRHNARIVRVLTVLGQPSTPEQLVEQTLIVLSQVYSADVVGMARVVADRLVLTGCCGLPETHPIFGTGWALGAAAAEALAAKTAVARAEPELTDVDIPAGLAELRLRSGVWVPLSGGADADDQLLFLFSRSGDPLAPTELHLLASVADRLRLAVDARERGVAAERLAKYGHQLSGYLELPQLLAQAAMMLTRLLGADSAQVVTIDGGRARPGSPDLLSSDPLSPDVLSPDPTSAVRRQPWPRPVSELPGWPAAARGEAFRGPHPGAGGGDARTLLCVPVTRDGGAAALLYAFRDGRRPFQGEAVETARIFANHLAAAMTNAELYRALRESEASLRHQATHDSLTGLANRSLAGQRLEQALAGVDPYPVGLLFCDLDKFKEVNDRLGHDAGDELLWQVADRLRGCVRAGDVLARFGGDEFVVVLDRIADLDEVSEVGRRIVRTLQAPFTLGGERVQVSASVGGVLGVRGRITAGAMLRDADAAMYAAKNRGPGLVEVFDEAASHRSLDRLSLRSDLAHAVERDELRLQYQPIFNLATFEILGFEALLRWHHPVRGWIPPDEFIPLAEETGAITPIGDWVLMRACRQLAAWQRLPGRGRLGINVNLSATQLQQPDVAAHTLAVINAAGVSPADICLEITEHSSIRSDVTEFATTLRAAGVNFALDDFGISYSNLSHLKRLPVGTLKIDRSFVAGMTAKDTDLGIVRAILAIADSIGLAVVAEGIETAEQRAALLALGCERGQGYLLGRPVSADAGTALLLDAVQKSVPARSR